MDKDYNLTLMEFLNLSENKKSLINVDDIRLTINNQDEIDYIFKFIVRNLDEYKVSVYNKKDIPCYRVYNENTDVYFELDYYPLAIDLDVAIYKYNAYHDDWDYYGKGKRYWTETEDKVSINLRDIISLIIESIELSNNNIDRLTQLIVDELYNLVNGRSEN